MTMITISDWVSDDVVKGTVAMNLIKPIDYRMSLVVRALGTAPDHDNPNPVPIGDGFGFLVYLC